MPSVHTEAQKAASKLKRAENPAASKKASQKWRDADPDKVAKGMETSHRTVSWRVALLALLLNCPFAEV